MRLKERGKLTVVTLTNRLLNHAVSTACLCMLAIPLLELKKEGKGREYTKASL